VIFDTDDLVFDPNALAHVAALEDMDSAERQLYVAGVGRYRHTLEAVAAATVSTEALAEEARRVVPAVEVSYNAVSAEMVDLAEAARVERSQRVCETVTVAYLSGTPTHNRDFEEAADALVWMLEEFPESRFVAVGHLELDDRFVRFGDRVRHMPLQPWRELPRILADVDVNLAPLEPDNPFTDSKSCLKYIEAGLVGVPTIASPRRDFVRAVRHGDNGLLADSPEEWRTALGSLVASPVLRAELGGRALADVRERHTTAARARALLPIIGGLVRATADEPLAVNWLVRAPIPRTGGYRTIFRLAAFLAEQGHPTQMYVEPIAHLAGFSRRRVEAFLAEHFGHLPFDVHVGHGHIAPADVSFATNWPTAATVAAHQASLFKAYLIQDYEPEFYDVHDPLHEEARRTYELPLRHICYGPHLAQRLEKEAFRPSDALEFALEPEFSLERAPGERPGPPRVLFFAKPDQARRGFGVGVEALRLLHESVPEAEIVLFGGDDDALGELPFPYRNLGSLTTAELAAALNEAHVFLSLSLTNISHAPYEAMACGCAVVEARVAAVEASLRDGENCLLAEPAPVPLAEALVRLVRDDELRVRLAGRANADVAGRTWERTGHELERLLLDWAFVRIDRKAAA
jgi:glycosyltransferase involved in cell wall biosynthesis